jgi:hypothetical protein
MKKKLKSRPKTTPKKSKRSKLIAKGDVRRIKVVKVKAKPIRTKPIKLTASQLAALDHLVGMGGEAYAGNGMFREATAKPLRRAGCIERLPGEKGVFAKYRITEHGRAERSRARQRVAAA